MVGPAGRGIFVANNVYLGIFSNYIEYRVVHPGQVDMASVGQQLACCTVSCPFLQPCKRAGPLMLCYRQLNSDINS